jgi:flotillin
MGGLLIIGGFVAVVAVIAIYAVLKNLLFICQPNEALIFSGGKKYSLVIGGRRVRKPIIERVDRLDLTNMVIDLSVKNAYSKGGIPMNIDAVANVKIAGEEPIIHKAIERLLGKSRKQVSQLAKETLEGNLRGVLATLTPEEINEDKTAFQKSLVEEAEQDLENIGLMLDTLNIQNISDDVNYLDSIGRKKSAEIQKLARIAEAENESTALIRRAENDREVAIAKINAEMRTARAEAERRIADAVSRRTAVVTEQRSQIQAEIVKATADLDVQEARIEQTRRKLQADVVEPARANMKAAISEAIGQSAKIVENGRATAEALEAVTQTWVHAGNNARDIFLLQKVDILIQSVLQTVNDMHVDRITVLPAGSGSSDGSEPLANKLVSTSEQLKAALGVDVPQMLQSLSNK